MPIDYSQYPPNWLSEIRPRILQRADNCCETCGAPNYTYIYRPHKDHQWEFFYPVHTNHFKPVKIILTIAHLNHDKENHNVQDEDLKALCQRCHLLYDLPRHIHNRKYGRNANKTQGKLPL